jgi:methionine-rich copper-binding protein CopC
LGSGEKSRNSCFERKNGQLMKNYLRSVLLLLFLFHTCLIFAHAVVTEHSLKIKPIRANRPDNVELSFNSQIELKLSQVFLVRKGDKHELLHIANGKKNGQMIISIPALDSGEYALRLKVFATDGHLTEDLIHFSVSK